MWICEWSQPGQCDMNVTVWGNRDSALVAACADMMADIIDNWDRSDSETNLMALAISDECASCNWDLALAMYNDWESDGDPEFAEHYRVYERPTNTTLPPVRLLRDLASKPIASTSNVVNATPVPFKAIKPGATCRGPCKQVSTDAYADRSDGTFCCYQCKYMSQAFGRPIP